MFVGGLEGSEALVVVSVVCRYSPVYDNDDDDDDVSQLQIYYGDGGCNMSR